MSPVQYKVSSALGPVVAAFAILAAALAGCGGTVRAATSPSTSAPRPTTPPTVTPTTRHPVPTTAWRATSPQPSPQAAADALVGAWATGNRPAAAAVATPAAVRALFAVRYPGAGLANSRGCSAAFPPIVCTYGPPGGGSPGDPVFDVYLRQTPHGWYVSSVMPEN
jgi:hypothetical protein